MSAQMRFVDVLRGDDERLVRESMDIFGPKISNRSCDRRAQLFMVNKCRM
jgi:hypothetical protein